MVKDILFGAAEAIRVVSLFYAGMLCAEYAWSILERKNAKWFNAVFLLIPLLVLYWEMRDIPDLKAASTPFIVSMIIAFAVGGYLVFRAFLEIYNRRGK